MLSLAGIPLTGGFFGKFFIFDAAIRQHQTMLLVVGVIHGEPQLRARVAPLIWFFA